MRTNSVKRLAIPPTVILGVACAFFVCIVIISQSTTNFKQKYYDEADPLSQYQWFHLSAGDEGEEGARAVAKGTDHKPVFAWKDGDDLGRDKIGTLLRKPLRSSASDKTVATSSGLESTTGALNALDAAQVPRGPPSVLLTRLEGWPTSFPANLTEYRESVLQEMEWTSDLDKHTAEIAPWVWHHQGDADRLQLLAQSADPETSRKAREEMWRLKIMPTLEPRTNASFVVLIRNREMNEFRATMRQLEDRFNHKFHYPYLFLNDEPFTDEFMRTIAASTTSNVTFALIPRDHWSVPEFIDESQALMARHKMAADNIIYGGSLSYRHMCRFNSGFFYKHPLLKDIDWYWRVEPGVEFYCDLDYDPFKYMQDNGKLYSFVITLKELEPTIPSLWDHALAHMLVNNRSSDLMPFFVSPDGGYNLCHFWSNFEIASLNWFRSPAYESFFQSLDRAGGFFMERWGDAPVHSIAAGMLLNHDQVHFFDDIGYKHADFIHCNRGSLADPILKCQCPLAFENFDDNEGSCLPKFKSFKPSLWTTRDTAEAIRMARGRRLFKLANQNANFIEQRRWYDIFADI